MSLQDEVGVLLGEVVEVLLMVTSLCCICSLIFA